MSSPPPHRLDIFLRGWRSAASYFLGTLSAIPQHLAILCQFPVRYSPVYPEDGQSDHHGQTYLCRPWFESSSNRREFECLAWSAVAHQPSGQFRSVGYCRLRLSEPDPPAPPGLVGQV